MNEQKKGRIEKRERGGARESEKKKKKTKKKEEFEEGKNYLFTSVASHPQ